MTYCYVHLVNPRYYHEENKTYNPTETYRLLSEIITEENVIPGYPNSSYIKLNGVQRDQDKLLPFPIICEYIDTELEDVITGIRFKVENRYEDEFANTQYETKYYTKYPKLKSIKVLSTKEVAEALRTLTDNDLARYKAALIKFIEAVEKGYEKDVARANQEVEEEKVNSEYIHSLRNKL